MTDCRYHCTNIRFKRLCDPRLSDSEVDRRDSDHCHHGMLRKGTNRYQGCTGAEGEGIEPDRCNGSESFCDGR